MATLDQTRATMAWDHIQAVKQLTDAEKNKYGTIVHALTPMLRTAGLSQSLHFVFARKSTAQKLLLDHLAAQLRRTDPAVTNQGALLKRAREAKLSDYLRLTQEALRCMNWYRRFVQGELKVEASDEADDREDEHG
jgi:CRISPR-associated protein Cmr5